jgi:hypothetical protein
MFRSAVGPRSGRQLDNKESIASRARPKPSKRHPGQGGVARGVCVMKDGKEVSGL